MNDEKSKAALHVLSYGVILGYLILASSDVYRSFAPVPLTAAWLYGATALLGCAIALSFEEVTTVFATVLLSVCLGVLIFSGVVALILVQTGITAGDVVGVYTFQQAFPRLLYLGFIGTAGAFIAAMVKMFRGEV